MSFSSDVKKELANIECDECCLRAELYAIIRFKSELKLSFNALGVSVSTTLNVVARRIVYLFKRVYDIKLDIVAYKQNKLDYKTIYVLELTDNAVMVLKDLKILTEDGSFNNSLNNDLYESECCKASIVRGAFLVKGSINNPSKSNYHLEITVSEEEDAKFLCSLINSVYIHPHIIKREKGYVIYLKRSEQIGDFLKFVGAINSLFDFEDTRIKRDYNNYVNRIINCELANQDKVLSNAQKQLDNIEYIRKYYGFVNLTPRLMDAVVLRTKYPEYSLQELSDVSEETIERYISKSGLSHCYKDLEKIVNDIQNKKEVNK